MGFKWQSRVQDQTDKGSWGCEGCKCDTTRREQSTSSIHRSQY